MSKRARVSAIHSSSARRRAIRERPEDGDCCQQAVEQVLDEVKVKIQAIKFTYQSDEHVEALTATIKIIDQVKGGNDGN